MAAAKPVSSPWTQIVRGESEPIASLVAADAAISAAALSLSSASSSSSAGEEENGPAGNEKKPAWNRPSNGSSSSELIGVMGADAWPALSESARASSKPNSDGSSSILPALQVTQITPSNSLNPRQGIDNANHNPTPSHLTASRPRPVKRNGPNASANGSTSQPTGLQIPLGEAYSNNSSPRDHNQRSSQSRGTSDHTQQPRNSYRNRGGGRGESSQHHNYGGRRDHDRPNQDWNGRNFNGRDAHLQPQRGLPRYIRQPPPPPPPPAPTSTPYMVPASVRPFGPPLPYPDYHMYYFPPPDSLRMPFFTTTVPQVFVPPADLQLHSKIINQIDYYFSNENLVKDTFLRQNMDDQGWVPISLIAGFNKVLHLTDNVQLLLDVLRSSSVVEVQGDKVRRRNEWTRWIMPPAVRFPVVGNSNLVDSEHSSGEGVFLHEEDR